LNAFGKIQIVEGWEIGIGLREAVLGEDHAVAQTQLGEEVAGEQNVLDGIVRHRGLIELVPKVQRQALEQRAVLGNI